MTSNELKDRTKILALKGIRLFQQLPKTDEAKIIGKQFLRSVTSVAANYRAACRARSDAEFYSKICIVVEEADETLFWIELMKEAELISNESLNWIEKESLEILMISSASKKTVKEKLKK